MLTLSSGWALAGTALSSVLDSTGTPTPFCLWIISWPLKPNGDLGYPILLFTADSATFKEKSVLYCTYIFPELKEHTTLLTPGFSDNLFSDHVDWTRGLRWISPGQNEAKKAVKSAWLLLSYSLKLLSLKSTRPAPLPPPLSHFVHMYIARGQSGWDRIFNRNPQNMHN